MEATGQGQSLKEDTAPFRPRPARATMAGMMDGNSTPTDDTPPPGVTTDRWWVPVCSDWSIKNNKVSLLALAEIPVATAFFGWLAYINPWPWTSLIGLLAAPILLLRSDASVEMGLGMLRRYWECEIGEWTGRDIIKGLLSGLILGGALVLVLRPWLPLDSTGWALPGWALILAWGGMTLAGSAISAVAGLGRAAWPGGMVGGGVGVAAGLWVAGAPLLAGMTLAALLALIGTFALSGTRAAAIPYLALFPALVLGLFYRAIWIRLVASLRHGRAGLAALPGNWLSLAFRIDPFHLPELLPRAGEIGDELSLSGVLQTRLKDDWAHILILAPIIYIPALLYRWNIKASWWLWGPLVLLLWPANWGDDEDMREDMACFTPGWLLAGLGSLWLAMVAWLAGPHLPADILTLRPDWARVISDHLTMPQAGLRLTMLWGCALALAGLLYSAFRLRAPHAKLLESAAEWDKYPQKERIKRRAKRVKHWRQGLTAFLILTVWSYGLSFAVERWPEVELALWPGLRAYL